MAEEQKPYVAAESNLAELTWKALLLGVVLAAMMGAANAYLALKAGQTVSATFPAAILALAAFRLPFFRGTVLEQNTRQARPSNGLRGGPAATFSLRYARCTPCGIRRGRSRIRDPRRHGTPT